MSKADEFYLEDLRFDGDIVSAPNGDLQTITGINNLKQALNNRLMTVKGSLAHRPFYGVGAQRYQNAISSLAKQQELAIEIRSQFQQDFRVNKVTGVSFQQTTGGRFIVKYKVEAKGIGLVEESFSPFGDFEA